MAAATAEAAMATVAMAEVGMATEAMADVGMATEEAEAEAEFEISELFDDIGRAALDDNNEDEQVSDLPVQDSEENTQ